MKEKKCETSALKTIIYTYWHTNLIAFTKKKKKNEESSLINGAAKMAWAT